MKMMKMAGVAQPKPRFAKNTVFTTLTVWAAKPAEVFVKFLVKFDLEFDLKFGILDGKSLVKFRGRTFRPARKALKISERISGQISELISGKFSETSFQISRLFLETLFNNRAVLADSVSLIPALVMDVWAIYVRTAMPLVFLFVRKRGPRSFGKGRPNHDHDHF